MPHSPDRIQALKTAETDFRIKPQYPKWRLPRPQHRTRRRRDPRGRASHALLPRDWLCARRSRNSFSRELRGSLAYLPLESERPGTISRGGGTGGEIFASLSLSHLLGARPGFHRARPGRREGGGGVNSAPSNFLGIWGLFQSLEKPAPVQSFKPLYYSHEICSLLSFRLHTGTRGFPLESWFLSEEKAGENGRAGFDPSLTTHLCLFHPSPHPPSLDLSTLIGTPGPLVKQV